MICAGTGTQIHAIGSYLHRNRGDLLGLRAGRFRNILRNFRVLPCHPTGVEVEILHRFVQLRHLSATGYLCIPAGKGVAFPDSCCQRLGGIVDVVALDTDAACAAVAVINDIGVIGRRCLGINVVKIQIGFCQTPPQQAGTDTAACLAPQGNGRQEVVAGGTADHRIAECAVLGRPRSAHIVCKHQQCIEFILIQLNAVAVGKIVQGLFKPAQAGSQQGLSLILRNAVGLVALIVCIGTGAAVANRIVGMIPAGILVKALIFLDQGDGRFTGSKSIFCGADTTDKYHSHQQNGCQKRSNHSFFHCFVSFRVSHFCYYNKSLTGLQPQIYFLLLFCYPLLHKNVVLF